MLTLDLDRELESNLLEIARKEHQTPVQIINKLIAQYIKTRKASNLLTDISQELPIIEAFAAKNPLSLQHKMREEALAWQDLKQAQTVSFKDWDTSDDDVWTTAEYSEMSLHQALRGMEDEQTHYTIDDLKECWQ